MWIIRLKQFAGQLGIETFLEFSSGLLVPESRIRDLCRENKCGNYRANYMCPPRIGSLSEIEARLSKFTRGILLQYSRPLAVSIDKKGVGQTKVDFHRKILQLEERLRNEGIDEVWGMIGGSCGLCEVCAMRLGAPCLYPNEARTSLEAIGVDVLAFLATFGLDNKFHPDRITWTGSLLY